MLNGASGVLRKLKQRVQHLRAAGPEGARFYALELVARTLMPDYKLSWYQIEWWKDRDFNSYLAHFGEAHGMNGGRRWMVHQLLRLVADVPGDTAECGVYRGAMSHLIIQANRQTAKHPRTHFLFDSFEGLSVPSSADGEHWHQGDLSISEREVRGRLGDCSGVRFMKGWIPQRFADVADRAFAFVHIDVDLYEPTRESVEFFYPRMSEGAIMVVDDYGFSSCPGALRALQEAAGGLADRMIALPDGGGFLIKGQAVAPAARVGFPEASLASD